MGESEPQQSIGFAMSSRLSQTLRITLGAGERRAPPVEQAVEFLLATPGLAYPTATLRVPSGAAHVAQSIWSRLAAEEAGRLHREGACKAPRSRNGVHLGSIWHTRCCMSAGPEARGRARERRSISQPHISHARGSCPKPLPTNAWHCLLLCDR